MGLVIIGAGGHGRVVLDSARRAGIEVAGFLADPAPERTNDAIYLGGLDRLADFRADHQFIVAIGDQQARRRISRQIDDRLVSVIDPSAQISPSALIGRGTAIIGGVIVNANASIGDYCILNTASAVDHDCIIEDGVQICPGVTLAGKIHCEEGAFLGTGAIVLPGVRIGRNAVIGAGAVVTRDVAPDTKLVGNPARQVGS